MIGPTCAACGSSDIRKLPAVVSDGTWSGRSETNGGGVAFGSDGGMAVGVGTSSTFHAGSTSLARTLAPPAQPVATSQLAVFLVALALMGGLAMFVGWLLSDGGLLSLAELMAPSIALAFTSSFLQRRAKKHAKPWIEKWTAQITRWQQLWYCPKCHSVSDLEAGKAAPAQGYAALL